jgi:large subunit ribosomal protein L16
MLLRPRKNTFKSSHKNRSLKTFNNITSLYLSSKSGKLVYGQYGLKNNNHNFLLFNKYLFKIKLFLKKAVRRSNITNRYLWVKVFPQVPLTKKVIGSRMGKGKGKSSNWAAKIPHGCIFIELRNVRPGRVKHFLKQIIYKLPGKYLILSKYHQNYPLVAFKKSFNRYNFFY